MKKIWLTLFLIFGFLFGFSEYAAAYYYGPVWSDTKLNVYIPRGEKYSTTMQHAFQRWQWASSQRFVFNYTDKEDDADIVVNFVDEVDGTDGDVGSYNVVVQGGNIRHANIDIVNNSDKKHSADMMFTTMLHEIGHAIGLSDSDRNFGIMHNPVTSCQDIVKRDIIILYKLYGWSTMPSGVYRY